MVSRNFNLALPFRGNAQKHPERLALWVDDQSYSYAELLARVQRLAAWMCAGRAAPPRRVLVLASRSMETCAAALAANWIGATYIPLNLKQSTAAIAALMRRTRPEAVVCDVKGAKLLDDAVLAECPNQVFVPSAEDVREGLRADTWTTLPDAGACAEPAWVDDEQAAYVLFTSGTTGTPKGVTIPARGVARLLDTIHMHWRPKPDDRVTESVDASFDISIFDTYTAWSGGASLHVIPLAQAAAPAKFLRDQRITISFFVPTVGVLMQRMGLLKANSYPDMRITIFCGEPLTPVTADAWQEACPNALVLNTYGPTEATVFCTSVELRPGGEVTKERGYIPIGKPLPEMEIAILDEDRGECAPEAPGELAIAGPQLALGYYDDAERTAERFVQLRGKTWYLTGDLAYYDAAGMLHFLGRTDNQVKVLGHRIELEDVESHLREVSGCDAVAAVPWPMANGSAQGLVGFVGSEQHDRTQLKAALKARMPSYMVPGTIYTLTRLPTSHTGKTDRNALRAMLDRGEL